MEKINIAELLKDCPKGMELDCTMFDDVKFIDVDEADKPICIRTGDTYRYLTKFGTWNFDENAKCVIFPKGKTTWERFLPPCQFKDGDIVATDSGRWVGIIKNKYNFEYYTVHCAIDYTFNDIFYRCGEYRFSRLATEEEKAKLFKVIKDNGYRWNSETKTLEKLPKFKVGDKVLLKGVVKTIKQACWDNTENEVIYKLETNVRGFSEEYYVHHYDLQPYKEETMEEIKIDIPKGYEFAGVDDDNQHVVFTKIQLEYPKTYEKCCDVLDRTHPINDDVEGYKWPSILSLQILLVCRDAYWKIAGEQMGLGKPWEPDWVNAIHTCTIICRSNKIVKDAGFDADNRILAFPTTEMRDAFYENFKELIEQCKELL